MMRRWLALHKLRARRSTGLQPPSPSALCRSRPLLLEHHVRENAVVLQRGLAPRRAATTASSVSAMSPLSGWCMAVEDDPQRPLVVHRARPNAIERVLAYLHASYERPVRAWLAVTPLSKNRRAPSRVELPHDETAQPALGQHCCGRQARLPRYDVFLRGVLREPPPDSPT